MPYPLPKLLTQLNTPLLLIVQRVYLIATFSSFSNTFILQPNSQEVIYPQRPSEHALVTGFPSPGTCLPYFSCIGFSISHNFNFLHSRPPSSNVLIRKGGVGVEIKRLVSRVPQRLSGRACDC